MKFLIAGFGSIGRRHMQNLLAAGEKDIIFYRTNHSTLPGNELEGFTVETDIRKALDHKPDAVMVCNPTARHLDIAIPAAEAGCHIMMEKPISSSLDGLDRLRGALKKGGGKLQVGFQFRFHPGLQAAKRLLGEGAIGKPLSFRAQWGEYLPGWHPWEDYRQSYSARRDLGGGVALTLCHPLDYTGWLLGEVKSLWSFTGRISSLEIDVEDNSEIGLRLADGVVGSIHLDYYQRPAVHRLEIAGENGTLHWDNADGSLRVYRAETAAWETIPAPQGFERNHLFQAELNHFIRVVRGEAEPACTLEDGEKALRLTLAVYRSNDEGRVVEL
jgi:predicted dehydrogenase